MTGDQAMNDSAGWSGSGQGRKAVVLLSGGLDSMVVAGMAREAGYEVCALTIDYNQRHVREIDAARTIVAALGVERHVILPLDLRQFGGSALTADIAVPKTGVGADIPVTYVPARNLVFLSLTLAWAEALGTRDIFIGVALPIWRNWPPRPGRKGRVSPSTRHCSIWARRISPARHIGWGWMPACRGRATTRSRMAVPADCAIRAACASPVSPRRG